MCVCVCVCLPVCASPSQVTDPCYIVSLTPESQAVMAEGKEHCVSIGITKMSTDDM